MSNIKLAIKTLELALLITKDKTIKKLLKEAMKNMRRQPRKSSVLKGKK
jgi:hypothetical protein